MSQRVKIAGVLLSLTIVLVPATIAAQASAKVDTLVRALPREVRGYGLESVSGTESFGLRWFRYADAASRSVSVGVSVEQLTGTSVDDVMRQGISTLKKELVTAMRNGTIAEVRFPLEGPTRDSVAGEVFNGYRLVAVSGDASHITVTQLQLYAIGNRAIGVLSRLPVKEWEQSDMPLFASDVLLKLVEARRGRS
jgi:hypothetical protein